MSYTIDYRSIASWKQATKMLASDCDEYGVFRSTRPDANNVRAPKRKRPQPRIIQPPPEGVDASGLASRVTYVGSPEHKTGPSFAGRPRPRGDATKCDTTLNDRLSEIQRWLQRAFQLQCFAGPWEGDFPRYAWCKVGNTVYKARLVNRGLGQYKGWQLKPEEWPDEIDDFDWDLGIDGFHEQPPL